MNITRRHDEEVSRLMHTNLSGLHMSKRGHAALLEKLRGGARMKRKLTLGLVLMLALVLTALAALAATALDLLNGYFKSKEEAYGIFEQWPMETKEDYSKLQQELGLQQGDIMYITPGEKDLGKAQAEAAAKGYIQDRAKLTDAEIGLYALQSVFFHTTNSQDRRWFIRFTRERDGWHYGQFDVEVSSPGGEILSYGVGNNEIFTNDPDDGITSLALWQEEKGPMCTWSQEDLIKYGALFENGHYRLGTAEDLPQEEAIRRARKAAAGAAGFAENGLDSLAAQAIIADSPVFGAESGCGIIRLYDPDAAKPDPYNVCIDAESGEVVNVTVPGGNG